MLWRRRHSSSTIAIWFLFFLRQSLIVEPNVSTSSGRFRQATRNDNIRTIIHNEQEEDNDDPKKDDGTRNKSRNRRRRLMPSLQWNWESSSGSYTMDSAEEDISSSLDSTMDDDDESTTTTTTPTKTTTTAASTISLWRKNHSLSQMFQDETPLSTTTTTNEMHVMTYETMWDFHPRRRNAFEKFIVLFPGKPNPNGNGGFLLYGDSGDDDNSSSSSDDSSYKGKGKGGKGGKSSKKSCHYSSASSSWKHIDTFPPVPSSPPPVAITTTNPTAVPSVVPSMEPSLHPSSNPSNNPSSNPSSNPSMEPSDLAFTDNFARGPLPTTTKQPPPIATTITTTNPATVAPSVVPSVQPSTILHPSNSSSNPSIEPSAPLGFTDNFPRVASPTTTKQPPVATTTTNPTIAPGVVPSIQPSTILHPSNSNPSIEPLALDSTNPSSFPTTNIIASTTTPTALASSTNSTLHDSPSSSFARWTVCGKPGNNCVGEAMLLPVNSTTSPNDNFPLGVRCCSDTKLPGFAIWGGGDGDDTTTTTIECPFADTTLGEEEECFEGLDYIGAEEICHSFGARLCTKTELEDGCAADSGCAFDNRYIWTSSSLEENDP